MCGWANPLGNAGGVLLIAVACTFLLANNVIPELDSSWQPIAQLLVYVGGLAWLLALVTSIILNQDFSTFRYGGNKPDDDPQPAGIVVFMLFVMFIFAGANGVIPGLDSYNRALAQTLVFGFSLVSILLVLQTILNHQDFSHLVFGNKGVPLDGMTMRRFCPLHARWR